MKQNIEIDLIQDKVSKQHQDINSILNKLNEIEIKFEHVNKKLARMELVHESENANQNVMPLKRRGTVVWPKIKFSILDTGK